MDATNGIRGSAPNAGLGGYELQKVLGRTGLGTVYLARQAKTDRTVLLTTLTSQGAKEPLLLADLLADVRRAAAVSHPHLANVLEAGQSGGVHYVASEHVAGESLASILEHRAVLPEKQALEIAEAIAGGLGALADAGLVHGRVHPSHVLMRPDGRPVLMAVGLGRTLVRLAPSEAAADPAPFFYVSPEQARGEAPYDYRSDMYSLGALLYRMIVGKAPFDGPNAAVVRARHLSDTLSFPPEAGRCSPAVRELIGKMMAKPPGERFASFLDVQKAIRGILRGERGTAEPPAEPSEANQMPAWKKLRRRRNRSLLNTLLGLALVVAVGGGLIYHYLPQIRDLLPRRPPVMIAGEPSVLDLYSAAAAYAEAHPDDYPGAIQRYEQIEHAAGDSPYQVMARQAVKGLQARQTEAGRKELEQRRQAAAALLAERKYGEALAVFRDFPAALRAPELESLLRQETQSIAEQARSAYEQVMARATARAAVGDAAGAIALEESIKAFGMELYSKQAQLQIEQLTGSGELPLGPVAPSAHKPLRSPQLAYGKVFSEFYALLARRDYLRARRVVENALADDFMEPVAKELMLDLTLQASARRFWNGLESLLPTLKGQPFKIGGSQGVVLNVVDGWIEFDADGVKRKETIDELSAQEAVELVERAPATDRNAARLASAVFLAASGAPEKAEEFLQILSADGVDAAKEQALVEHVRHSFCEKDAWEAWQKLGERMADRAWNEAEALARRVREDYAQTDVAKALGEQFPDWPEWIAAARRATGSLRGRVEFPEPRRVRVSYDFAEPAQAADWGASSEEWECSEGMLMHRLRVAAVSILHTVALEEPSLELLGRGAVEGAAYGAVLVDEAAARQYVFLMEGRNYHVLEGPYMQAPLGNHMSTVQKGTLRDQPDEGECRLVRVRCDGGSLIVTIDSFTRLTVQAPDFKPTRAGLVALGMAQFDAATLSGTLIEAPADASTPQ